MITILRILAFVNAIFRQINVLVGVNVCCLVVKILKKNSPIYIRTYPVEWRKTLLDIVLHIQCQSFWHFVNCEYLVNGKRRGKHYYYHQILSRVFSIEWCHCDCSRKATRNQYKANNASVYNDNGLGSLIYVRPCQTVKISILILFQCYRPATRFCM